jgi:hypothetical protein
MVVLEDFGDFEVDLGSSAQSRAALSSRVRSPTSASVAAAILRRRRASGGSTTMDKIGTKSWHWGRHPTGPYGALGATCTAERLMDALTKTATKPLVSVPA